MDSHASQNTDAEWVDRGYLPPLAEPQLESLVGMILMRLEETESVRTRGQLQVIVRLGSGRTVRLEPTIMRIADRLGLQLVVDDIHPADVTEVHELHERIVALVSRSAWLAWELMESRRIRRS